MSGKWHQGEGTGLEQARA